MIEESDSDELKRYSDYQSFTSKNVPLCCPTKIALAQKLDQKEWPEEMFTWVRIYTC